MLPECINFVVDGVRNGGGVLVHCMSGVSRSAAVSIAYKMKVEGMTYDAAYTELKTARPDVDPNAGFIAQVRATRGDRGRNNLCLARSSLSRRVCLQLQKFKEMSFSIDGEEAVHAEYRASRLVMRRRTACESGRAASCAARRRPTRRRRCRPPQCR